jgi:arginyl-tRNA synthetase
MKKRLESLLEDALAQLKAQSIVPDHLNPAFIVDRTKDSSHGDFFTNLAMVLGKQAGINPRTLASHLIESIEAKTFIRSIEVAGPGFINFSIDPSSQFEVIKTIHDQGKLFGHGQSGLNKKVQIEFVSANPTGPLHVGHGRGAAYGSVVANLLESVGYSVEREYYVNDAGRQMDILATSVWLRYLELRGIPFSFPSNGYRGEYVKTIAAQLSEEHANLFEFEASAIFSDIPQDEPDGGDKETHIDALIARCKSLLGEAHYRIVFDAGLNEILSDIRCDLEEFGVTFETWFSERSLTDSGLVQEALERLKKGGHLYEKDGAIWFSSESLGDEKDRVVVRENGQMTYFASDIAYHMNKLDRGFDQIINIWGADHHGYIPRVKAAISALGGDATKLDVLLVQFAVLYRGEEKVQMSTRSGEFVTLRQLRDEVGRDAARFFYVMRKSDQHMDFDLKLAASNSNENPVFYVQYAHARICSVLRQLDEKGLGWDSDNGMAHLTHLTEPHELSLVATLSRYPELIESLRRKKRLTI